LNWHYTLEPDSWLSIARYELPALAGQSCSQRIPATASSIPEVPTWVREALSNRDRADRLIASPDTVEPHEQNIQSKLVVTSLTAAVARARELNLL